MIEVFPSISFLIPELVTGSEQAWTRLFDKYHIGLTSKARNLCFGQSTERAITADDLVQETYLKAWNNHQSFRGETTNQFSMWILTILRNTFRDGMKSQRHVCPLGSWYDFPIDDETPSVRVVSDEREAALHACLAEMDSHQQQILTLRHFEGLKFIEIADRCQMNANTVASQYRRAIRHLTDLMKSREGDAQNGQLLADAKLPQLKSPFQEGRNG